MRRMARMAGYLNTPSPMTFVAIIIVVIIIVITCLLWFRQEPSRGVQNSPLRGHFTKLPSKLQNCSDLGESSLRGRDPLKVSKQKISNWKRTTEITERQKYSKQPSNVEHAGRICHVPKRPILFTICRRRLNGRQSNC